MSRGVNPECFFVSFVNAGLRRSRSMQMVTMLSINLRSSSVMPSMTGDFQRLFLMHTSPPTAVFIPSFVGIVCLNLSYKVRDTCSQMQKCKNAKMQKCKMQNAKCKKQKKQKSKTKAKTRGAFTSSPASNVKYNQH